MKKTKLELDYKVEQFSNPQTVTVISTDLSLALIKIHNITI